MCQLTQQKFDVRPGLRICNEVFMEIRGSFDETWSAATAGLLFNRAVIPALLFAHSITVSCLLAKHF